MISVLLQGSPNTGKTALAAYTALKSDFSFVKMISPDDLLGYGDLSKVNQITKIFDKAYKSTEALIIIDNIERLIEYVSFGPRFSAKVLDAITVLLKKIPDKEDGKLLIIGTTSKPLILKDFEITSQFDYKLTVPRLGAKEILSVLLSYKCDPKVA